MRDEERMRRDKEKMGRIGGFEQREDEDKEKNQEEKRRQWKGQSGGVNEVPMLCFCVFNLCAISKFGCNTNGYRRWWVRGV